MPCAALNSYNHLSTSQVFSISTYFSLLELKKSKVCLMHQIHDTLIILMKVESVILRVTPFE